MILSRFRDVPPLCEPQPTILPKRRLARFMPLVSLQALCDNSLASMIPSDSGRWWRVGQDAAAILAWGLSG